MLIVLKFLFCSFYIHVQSRPLDRGGGQAIPHEETHDHQRLTGQAQSKEDWTTQGADWDQAGWDPGQARAGEEEKGEKDLLVY